jgi:hypothetical protein
LQSFTWLALNNLNLKRQQPAVHSGVNLSAQLNHY